MNKSTDKNIGMSKAEANQKPAAATPRLAEELNARVANEDKGTHNGVSGAGVTPRLVAAPKARVMDEGKGTIHSHGKP